GNRLNGNEIGVETYGGAESIRISDTTIEGSEIGMLLDAADSSVHQTSIEAGERGIELRAPTEVTGLTVRGPELGVVVKAEESTLRDIEIEAAKTGIRVTSGSRVTVEGGHVVAVEPIDGLLARASGVVVDADTPMPLLGWLG